MFVVGAGFKPAPMQVIDPIRVHVCNVNTTFYISKELFRAKRFRTIKVRVQVADLNPPKHKEFKNYW